MRSSKLCPFNGLRLLDGVSRRDQRAIAHLGTTLDFAGGTTLEPGAVACGQHIVVVRGVVRFIRDGITQGVCRAGESWGDGGLFAVRSGMTAFAVMPLRIHVYDDREMQALRAACPLLAHRLLRTGTDRRGGRPAEVIPPSVPVRAYPGLAPDARVAQLASAK
jgi:hypothetical protein